MSNSNWDWWFGDGPLARRVISPQAIAVWPKRWLRSVRLRRWLLSLAVLGSQGVLVCDNTRADSPEPKVVVAPVSFGWASPDSASMLVAQGTQNSVPKNSESQDRQDRLDDLLESDQASGDEDARRRQRLKDLLNGGMEGDPQPNREAKDQPTPVPSEPMQAQGDEKDLFAEPFIEERLPEVAGGRFILPPLRAVSIDQAPIGNGKVPESLEAGEELTLAPLPEDGYARSLLTDSNAWPSLIRPWAAPNTFSHPLYFEDRMLERHGHERWGCLQPIASGARFFVTVPMLPYLTTIQEPCDIVYSKGYYRAGSPAPRMYQRPPLERRAVMVEAASIAGGFIAFP
ncbi:hypothetical protein [Neorhodopirellula pilleata]|uniref:Uncharacterized protein n=1 Tax=Neorhodopirellula pilleata TaxID=2714738 RepID=A0A5C6A696_9BACT|nr:hypothetical protein [Neorhodopirellula pilleata]TWT95502.1 hypothetical protein Pla100_31430 [Neorhodopirellula pilleata]